mgnify:CR=1 FL=1
MSDELELDRMSDLERELLENPDALMDDEDAEDVDDEEEDEEEDEDEDLDPDLDADEDDQEDDAGDDAESDDEADAAEPEETPAEEPKKAEAAPELPDMDKLNGDIAAFKDRRKEVMDQYEDGDLTEDERDEALSKLDDERDTLIEQRASAKVAIETAQAEFNQTVQDYIAEYPGLRDQAILEAMDANFGHPSIANLPLRAKIQAAHEMTLVQAKHTGMKVPPLKAEAPAPAEKKAKATKAKEPAKRPMRDVPPTIADVPSAASAHDGEFGHLDGLEGVELEKAMQKMTAEQYERYLAAL